MLLQVQLFPIIQTGPADFGSIEREPQSPDEMQSACRRHAGAPDIPGVPWNIRLIKDYVHGMIITSPRKNELKNDGVYIRLL
jgi:hypothetical protein